ncbi:histidine kinase [Paenibacillus sp. MMS20-IR301]|uniref:sensor histidine kinase n=1 Tax=Paenibacillus sp. MMS20-IR301 TaxID=2895946 RepID=UPI0028E77EB5|nr:histidine kinase [Paenibacillus sp. MMS20-IR301]WNS44067.1 histidine kinase [Paenibacillus sp. MMS20-IR301]
MRYWLSMRFRIVFGFLLIVTPLVLFLIYNNLYAARIVREQISANYGKLSGIQVNANDSLLKNTYNFLIQLDTANDSEILSLKTLPVSDPDYTLAKVRLYNRFLLDTNYYKMIDTFFVYLDKESNYPLFATQNVNTAYAMNMLLKSYSAGFASRGQGISDRWEIIRMPGGGNYLIKAVDIGFGMLDGALVQLDTLNQTLAALDVGPEGSVFIMDGGGRLLSSGMLPDGQDNAFRTSVLQMEAPSGTLQWKNKKYLVLTQSSQYSDIRYVIVTPESYILKNLPYLQKLLYYWVPLLSVMALSGYILYLQRFLFRPLARLTGGMRKLGYGMLDVRLPDQRDTKEFSLMTTTFNEMARHIEQLKIDVYEEQLRVQRAEYKHLQMQINPHFYMNSLNIIYNMAALKEYKSVQKMSLHLADYFRFLMHGDRSSIPLENELGHIRHYLEIQKLRYMDMLDYEFQVLQEHLKLTVSPLLLQPFVENAILHGLTARQQDGTPFRIIISSADDSDPAGRYAVITITDNGPGFPEDMLSGLVSGRYADGTGDKHLGIWNVLRRYKLLYGDGIRDGIRFSNCADGGAVVEVRLPQLSSLPGSREGAGPQQEMKEDTDGYDAGGR